MKKLIIATLLTVSCTVALADSVIITQTKTWKSVPITVDTEKHIYTTVEGSVVPERDYYYTYSGYRCLREKVEVVGTNVVIFKSGTPGAGDIYCYPDE